jgi:NAD-reducing hydrogenase small subunit
MQKLKVATVWLDGCSGCHMSILDMDERLVELAQYFDIVYSPYIDTKEFPSGVDLAIVEGAISSTHDLELIHKIRDNSKLLLALGDCAITGNISAMKNLYGTEEILRRGYFELMDENSKNDYPKEIVPSLLDKVVPLNNIVKVDISLKGCPPPADAIYEAIKSLIENKEVDLSKLTRFGK